jgi:ArsR family transcriptional regulator, arsenate/arsenite/antimonite-responsive transcriptional repressor
MSNRKAISPVRRDRAGCEDMEEKLALAALAALAHETRLAVFRLLVTIGPSGLPAGEIAERLGVVASTLSFHLKELDRAGLLRSWRRQRQIFYAADYEGTRGLLAFLTRDCCQGHPEICGDLARLAAVPEPQGRRMRSALDQRGHEGVVPGR